MREIFLPNGRKTIVDDEDYEKLNKWKWCLGTNGHVQRLGGSRKTKRVTIHMAREIINVPKGFKVDHINRDKTDNRKSNLRAVTHRENVINRDLQRNSTTGYRGVWWHKHTKKYTASITSNHVVYSLGYFDDPVEASEAYKEAAKRLHGKFNPSSQLG